MATAVDTKCEKITNSHRTQFLYELIDEIMHSTLTENAVIIR